MSLQAAVVEFLKVERNWISRESLVQSLYSLGQHSGGEWPRASREAWDNAVSELVESKQIVQSPHGLRWRDVLFMTPAVMPRKAAPRQRAKADKPDNGQGMLF